MADGAGGPLLSIEELEVSYGPVIAVRGVTMHVKVGEVVALLGVNGAGKSSVLNAFVGVVPTSGGEVRFDGERITGRSPESIVQRGLTLCPEGRRIFSSLTIEENLRVAAGFRSRDSYEERELEVIELFPVLSTKRESLGAALSGGQQQQLAIARALMQRPQMLLLDEPSLGLAPKVANDVFALIDRLRERGITILLVEQNAERALQLASRCYVLQSGRVVLEGTPDELRAADLESAYLGLPTENVG